MARFVEREWRAGLGALAGPSGTIANRSAPPTGARDFCRGREYHRPPGGPQTCSFGPRSSRAKKIRPPFSVLSGQEDSSAHGRKRTTRHRLSAPFLPPPDGPRPPPRLPAGGVDRLARPHHPRTAGRGGSPPPPRERPGPGPAPAGGGRAGG